MTPPKKSHPWKAFNPGWLQRSHYRPTAERQYNPRTKHMERVK